MPKPPPQLESSWQNALNEEWNQPYIEALASFLKQERQGPFPIYPPAEDVFAAFSYSPFDKTQVVIVGQDPYHGPGQAHGLSFSVRRHVPLPPSLRNIFQELRDDLGIEASQHGSLVPWAKQGVLLLNTVLTVRERSPASHAGKGWERFTDAVVASLAKREDPIIFVLWGRKAEQKCEQLKGSHHFFLTSAHPSPYSAHSGFFGSRPFSKINELLKQQGKTPIQWELR